VVICLEQGADLHIAQPMPLPLTVSCSSKIQIVFTFLVPAHLGSPGQRVVKRVCVCVCGFSEVKLKLILTEMLHTFDCTRFSELLDYQPLTVTLIMTCGFVIVFL